MEFAGANIKQNPRQKGKRAATVPSRSLPNLTSKAIEDILAPLAERLPVLVVDASQNNEKSWLVQAGKNAVESCYQHWGPPEREVLSDVILTEILDQAENSAKESIQCSISGVGSSTNKYRGKTLRMTSRVTSLWEEVPSDCTRSGHMYTFQVLLTTVSRQL